MGRSTPSATPTDAQLLAADRALVVRDAVRQDWTGELRLRRDDLVLVAAKAPQLFAGAAPTTTGVDAWVRLYRDHGRGVLEELPVDPHRIFTNPPTRTTKGGEENAAAAFESALWDSVLTNPNPAGWRTRGTVTTVFSIAGDGEVNSQNATYATARTGGTLAASTAGTLISVGQRFVAGNYTCYESFLGFDTSAITDSDIITVVTLDLWVTNDLSTNDFTIEARERDWSSGGLTTADWVSGASLTGITPLYASRSTSGLGTGAYQTLTSQAAFLTATNLKTGTVYMIVDSSAHAAGSPTPTGNDYIVFSSADETGTTQDPKLTITHNAAVFAPPPPPPPPNRIWTVY